jgi:MFS family permease
LLWESLQQSRKSGTEMHSPRPGLANAILFLVVFLDMAGYGVLIPLVPFYVERLGAGPELITAVVAAHSLAQLLVTPLWGSVSHHYGRRPVLVISMVGHAAAYLILA